MGVISETRDEQGAVPMGVVFTTRLALFLLLESMDLLSGVFRFHTIIFLCVDSLRVVRVIS